MEQGAPAHSMLALALSPQAAASMLAAIEELVEPPYEELHVRTFGSFCERLLRDEAPEAGLAPDFAAVSRADRVALMLDSLGDLSLRRHEIRGNPAPLLAGFVARIDRLKAEMISARGARRARAEAAPEDSDAERSHQRARAASSPASTPTTTRCSRERGALDSRRPGAARVPPAARAARTCASAPRSASPTCSWTTSRTPRSPQVSLLALLCAEHGRVTVAGDERQATHRLRGAGDKNLADFERAFPRRGRWCDLGREHGADPPVRFWRCASERAQAQAVAAECERLLGDRRATRPRSRCWSDSLAEEGPVVGSALEERAVPFRLSGSAAYFQRAEVRDVLAWMRLLADPADSGAAVRALSRPPDRAALGGHRAAHPARAPAQARHAVGGRAPRSRARSSRPRAATARRRSCACTARRRPRSRTAAPTPSCCA